MSCHLSRHCELKLRRNPTREVKRAETRDEMRRQRESRDAEMRVIARIIVKEADQVQIKPITRKLVLLWSISSAVLLDIVRETANECEGRSVVLIATWENGLYYVWGQNVECEPRAFCQGVFPCSGRGDIVWHSSMTPPIGARLGSSPSTTG